MLQACTKQIKVGETSQGARGGASPPPAPAQRLEHELECKLHRAWPPHRVKRTLDTKRVRQRRCCQPELVAPQKGANRAKVRMVEDVESLGSELELQVFIERELPAYCQVHLPCAETSPKGARGRALTRRTGRAGRVNTSAPVDCPTAMASLPGP